MATLEEVLYPLDFGGEDTLEARAAIERLSVYLNRDDFTRQTVSSPLMLAARTLARQLEGAQETLSTGGISSEKVGDVTVQYDTAATQTDANGLTPDVKALARPYRLSPGL